MKNWIKVTLVAGGLASAGLAGYGAGKMGAYAQGGPGMGPGMGQGQGMGPGMGQGMGPGQGQGMGPGMGQGMMGQGMGERGRGHHAHGGQMGGRMSGPFAQFFINRDNKNLTNDDVKKIAEAGLLWFGERNWRIGEVKDSGSRTAEFVLVTTEGGVIARFTMDRDSGRVRRIA
ncbi:hypothetical protein [Elioraea sp.]|uniref:hypothetical protein n=1 Tax=Elioraea sp. TaxID=2185103 RepID=UPI0025C4FCA1|nr:hypothetical protein [Elioraea sp.]